MNNVPNQPAGGMRCSCCGGTSDLPHNPLLAAGAESCDGDSEYVHRLCVKRSSNFGFCWCCGEEKVYPAEYLNEASECPAHEGESIPDYPEEDLESFIEYMQKDG